MNKNVVVFDENGTMQSPTYPRRARGLVKSGRARWTDATTICLTRSQKKEDLEMEFKKEILARIDAITCSLDGASESQLEVYAQAIRLLQTLVDEESRKEYLALVEKADLDSNDRCELLLALAEKF